MDGDRPRCPRVGRGLVRRATAGSRSTRRRAAGRSRPTYTNASDSADAIRALGTGRFLAAGRSSRRRRAAACVPRRRRRRTQRARGAARHPARAARGRAARRSSPSRAARRGAALRTGDPAALARRPRGPSSPPSCATRARRCRRSRRSTSSRSSCDASGSERRVRGRVRAAPVTARSAGAAAAADETRRELRGILSLLRDRLGPGRRIRRFLARAARSAADGSGTMRR